MPILATKPTKAPLATDLLYAIGYGDGLAGRFRDRKYSSSLDYGMGYVQGDRHNPDSLFNLLPKNHETPLERGAFDELLNAI
jgi:hypothetical protein